MIYSETRVAVQHTALFDQPPGAFILQTMPNPTQKNLTSQACFHASHAHLNYPRYVFFGKQYTNPSNKSVSISYDDAQQLRQHRHLATLSVVIYSKIVYVRYERICTLWPINVTFQCPLQFAYFMKTRETSSRPPKATTKGKHHCSPIKLYIRFIAR